MAGRTMDVIIIAWLTNLIDETSGLKADKMLVPANARYASRQRMWGGKVSLRRREACRTANESEIAANVDHAYLFSGWGAMRLCRVPLGGPVVASINKGDTIIV